MPRSRTRMREGGRGEWKKASTGHDEPELHVSVGTPTWQPFVRNVTHNSAARQTRHPFDRNSLQSARRSGEIQHQQPRKGNRSPTNASCIHTSVQISCLHTETTSRWRESLPKAWTVQRKCVAQTSKQML